MPRRRTVAMTTEHKAALAAGRTQGAAVRRYLEALESSKPRRGRRVTKESVANQLLAIEEKFAVADPLQRLHLIQLRKDLESRLGERAGTDNLAEHEAAFIKAAAEYGARKGIHYSTWREMGVSAAVLQKAGIGRAS